MAFDILYYTTKKQKLEEKITKEKDEFLVELANENMGLANKIQKFSQRQQELNEEYQEIVKMLEENKKLEEKDGNKEADKK
jgi:predicted transcriptional regulator